MKQVDWKSCKAISHIGENVQLDLWVSEHHEAKGRDLKIVEIGSYQGHSTSLLAQYGTVIAIDLWSDIHDGETHPDKIGSVNYSEFRANMVRLGLFIDGRVFPVIGTSAVLTIISPSDFDVIYVDGAHYYDPVKKDIANTIPHLADDGLFLFHDYKRKGDRPDLGVNIAVDELLASGGYEISKQYKGLACLRKKVI